MGKKRPASSLTAEEPANIGFDTSGTKLNIRGYEDVADSEDEFLLQRDKILLDERPEVKRRRKIREEEALLEASDEEVLALPESENSDDNISASDEDELDGTNAPRPRTSKLAKDPPGNTNDDDEDDEEEGWGDTRDAYYGADTIDTEQAALEEEAEAKRLQQKSLTLMSEADFGFDDGFVDEYAEEIVDDLEENVVAEILPELQVTENMGPAERMKAIKQRYPEFEHIAKEFLEMHSMLEEAEQQARLAKELILLRSKTLQQSISRSESESHPAILKHHALAMNLGVVAMYFAILTSTADKSGNTLAKPPVELREHSIMDSLLKCRQIWTAVRGIAYPDINNEIKALRDRIAAEEQAEKVRALDTKAVVASSDSQITKPKKKKSKAQKAADAAEAESEERRAEKMRTLEADLASLTALATKSTTAKSNATTKAKRIATKPSALAALEEDSDFGDETELSARELAEKARRKRTLSFYTSQIAQKANKRGLAAKDAGGDMDIPHRERFRERQAKDAERRKKKYDTQDVADEDFSGDDTMDRNLALPNDGEDEEDYYDMVAARSKQKKADKAAAAQAYSQALKEGGRVVEEETIGEDGKRKITYAIEKNKGITPTRRKEVRNPRAKQKMKYKKKQTKLGSMRQVYTGGEGKGGYGGELTGIKTGLVKSVKL